MPLNARAEPGQALVLMLGALVAVLLGAVVLGGVAQAITRRGDSQRAADIAALAGARALRTAYPRVFEPAEIAGRPNPVHLERSEYVAIGRRIALETARRNGARDVEVEFPGDALAPLRVRVRVRDEISIGPAASVSGGAIAEAELVPPGTLPAAVRPGAGEYTGPLAIRQGKPMRPDVAQAFDRMEAAAEADGVHLIVVSGFRSSAEQAALFAAHPDPKWVAPPGQSLHRLGTELDLGPASAYAWLNANAKRFGFLKRYSWEPWHLGLVGNAASSKLGYGGAYSPDRRTSLPAFVPERYVK